jgi:hypothetical protein
MALLHGSNLVPDIVAVIGVLVWCAGLHLLWNSRAEILAWAGEYIRLFRISVKQQTDPSQLPPLVEGAQSSQPRHTMRIVLGFVLAFFVAPMLITLGLAF